SREAVLGIPEWAGFIFVFVLGACIGSFLNVVIYRVPNEKSLLPSSACPNCNNAIKSYHNIPILGWLMLGGKCANCKEPIAWRYPAVELLTALVFCLVYWQIGPTPYLPVALAFVAAMLALIFIDAEHMILPNVITYPMFVIALIVRIVYPLVFNDANYFSDATYSPISSLHGWPPWTVSLAGALFGALIGGGSLWLVGAIWKLLRGVDAMGLGGCKAVVRDRGIARLAIDDIDNFYRCVHRSHRRRRTHLAAKGQGPTGADTVWHIPRHRVGRGVAIRRQDDRMVSGEIYVDITLFFAV
ncbi:MAG: prepilin peptidase, partial [Pyrinomonadaceae bacterium]